MTATSVHFPGRAVDPAERAGGDGGSVGLTSSERRSWSPGRPSLTLVALAPEHRLVLTVKASTTAGVLDTRVAPELTAASHSTR